MKIDSISIRFVRHVLSLHTDTQFRVIHLCASFILALFVFLLLISCAPEAATPPRFQIAIADFRSENLSRSFEFDIRKHLSEKIGAARKLDIDFFRCSVPVPSFADCVSPALSKKPDVFYATTTTMAMEVKRLAPTQPLLFSGLFDPVAQGLVKSYSAPGEYATGFVSFADAGQKRLELLWQAFPHVRKIGILAPTGTLSIETLEARRSFARAQGRTVEFVQYDQTTTPKAIQEILKSSRYDAFDIPTTPALRVRYENIIQSCISQNKPCIFMHPDFVKKGGLFSYGPVEFDYAEKAAKYIARIANGEPIGSIPVETPTQFELALNTKSALTLSTKPNKSFLLRVTTFIE